MHFTRRTSETERTQHVQHKKEPNPARYITYRPLWSTPVYQVETKTHLGSHRRVQKNDKIVRSQLNQHKGSTGQSRPIIRILWKTTPHRIRPGKLFHIIGIRRTAQNMEHRPRKNRRRLTTGERLGRTSKQNNKNHDWQINRANEPCKLGSKAAAGRIRAQQHRPQFHQNNTE